MTARTVAVVSGHVQGVGYRWFVNRQAARLGVVGWVANESDGSVRVVAEGPRPVLDELLEELRRGPSGARVESVEVEQRIAATGSFSRFEIRSRGHSGD